MAVRTGALPKVKSFTRFQGLCCYDDNNGATITQDLKMTRSLPHTGHTRCVLWCSQVKLTLLTCVLVLLLHAHLCMSAEAMPHGDARHARYRRQTFPPRPQFCQDPLGFRCSDNSTDPDFFQCLPLGWFCDQIPDCFNGRDEDCVVGSPCDDVLCSNRGLCTSLGAPGSYTCDCLSGIMGPICQSQNINQIPQATVDQISQNSARLTWDQPPPVFEGNADAEITNYIVTFTPSDGSQPVTFDDVPAAAGSYFVTGLTPGTTYIVDTDYFVSRGPGDQPQPFNVDLPSQTFTTSKS
ncbi:uncharacterized protein [Amphiura filiformis]|uniref:uncharacterized protein n=1 Tax=Amphiura filiformis TaxID=82378 RepID=UPI003B227691